MDVVRQVITIVLMVISVLMIVVVLMQKSKEGGLGAAFGGGDDGLGGLSSAKGRAASKEAKLQKITKVLAITMGALALVMVALPA